jgi:hypothetical protein
MSARQKGYRELRSESFAPLEDELVVERVGTPSIQYALRKIGGEELPIKLLRLPILTEQPHIEVNVIENELK